MRVLVAMQRFQYVGGTETYVLTVAEQLQRLGHQVGIYAAELGDMALLARDRAVDVTQDPDELVTPDVVLSQDAVLAYELAGRWPGVRQVFVHHSPIFEPQLPPLVPGVVDTVVVMSERFRERLDALDAKFRLARLRQPIDTERLVPRSTPRPEPRRALLLGNTLAGETRQLIVDTWAEQGLEVVQVGMGATPTLHPEAEIEAADIVVGRGRAVLDAMSCGRPAYLYDEFGADGWVTAQTYGAMESGAFAGQAFPDVIVDADRLREDLAAYDPGMGHVNRTLVMKHHQARMHVQALVGLFREVSERAADAPPVTAARELSRLTRLRWRAESELNGLRGSFATQQARLDEERSAMHRELQAAVEEREAARAEVTSLQEQLRVAWEDRVRLDAELVAERARHRATARRRDRARARGRAFKARYDRLSRSRWVRLGRAARLLPRTDPSPPSQEKR
jgi:hypothetical protein